MLHHRSLTRPTTGRPEVQHSTTSVAQALSVQRRDLLASGFALLALASQAGPARAADSQTVGAYLPPAGVGDLVQFVPAPNKTPALRAGTIRPEERYAFALPPSVKESRISNTQNGNFCQPRCAEPWTEVVFEDGKLGKIQLLALPLLKLTNSKSADIKALGSPEALLPRVGPYITGTYYDEDWLEDTKVVEKDDGLTYYQIQLNALDALNNGPHSLTSITAKGEVVYMFILSATEKQWKASEGTLRTVLDSFRA